MSEKKEPWLFRRWFGAYVIWTTWRLCRRDGGSFMRVLPIVHDELVKRGAIKQRPWVKRGGESGKGDSPAP